MIKLLAFAGPCSFATFLATAGEGILPLVRFVRCFEHGSVVCFLNIEALDEGSRSALLEAIRMAHAVEPVRLDHDIDMSPAVITFLAERLGTAD